MLSAAATAAARGHAQLLARSSLPRTLFGARTAVRVMSKRNESEEERRARKEAVKAQKAARRLQRQGALQQADPDFGRKPCELCSEMKDTLIRCQVDASQAWRMVCGKCWREVSGGVVDGDADHPHYRYGGLWRNLHKPK